MTSNVEKKFLRLFMFVHKVSLPVVREFLLHNTASNSQNEDKKFHDFLKNNIHNLYHLIGDFKCCQCSLMGNVPRRAFRITKEQFEKMYLIGQSKPNHYLRGAGGVIQYCLCCISVNTSCIVRKLEMTLLLSIIKHCVNVQNDEDMWLNIIQKKRNQLCHPGDIAELTENEVDLMWSHVEMSILGLASKIPPFPRYQDSIEMQIELLKDGEYGWSHVQPLMESMKSELNNNINCVRQDMESMKSYFITQHNQLEKQFDHNKDEIQDSIKGLECDLAVQGADIKRILDSKEADTKQLEKIEKMITKTLEHKINELTFKIEYAKDSSNDKIEQQCQHEPHDDLKCAKEVDTTQYTDTKQQKRICITISTPGFLEKEKDKIIKSIQKSIGIVSDWAPFEIDFVIDGSIIICAHVPVCIMDDENRFCSSIRAFLDTMVNICNVDTSKTLTIKVRVSVVDKKDQDYVRFSVENQLQIQSSDKAIQSTPRVADKQSGPVLTTLSKNKQGLQF